jgi:hypothetical protein
MTETQGWVKRTEVFWFCLSDFGGKMFAGFSILDAGYSRAENE